MRTIVSMLLVLSLLSGPWSSSLILAQEEDYVFEDVADGDVVGLDDGGGDRDDGEAARRPRRTEPVPLEEPGAVEFAAEDLPVRPLVQAIVTDAGYDFVTSGDIPQTVTLVLTGVSIREALDTITTVSELEYRVDGRIITLFGRESRSEYTKIYKLEKALALQVGPKLREILGIPAPAEGGPVSAAPLGAPGGEGDPLAALAAGGGAPVSSSGGEGETRSSIVVDSPNNQLVIRARPSEHRRIAQIMPTLDVVQQGVDARFRVFELKYISPQVFLEALLFQVPGFSARQFLVLNGSGGSSGSRGSRGGSRGGAAATVDRAVGASSGAASGSRATSSVDSQSNRRRVLVTDTEERLESIARILDQLDRAPRQIYVEVALFQLNQGKKNNFGVNLQGLINQQGRNVPLAEFFSKLTGNNDQLRLRAGTLGPEQFSVVFDYLKSTDRAEILASPRLLIEEGETADIEIITEFPVFELVQRGEFLVRQVKFIPVGTRVDFTPTVTKDDMVRMKVEPEISTVSRIIQSPDGDTPVKDTNTLKTILYVKSGHTAIIGGLKSSNRTRSVAQQPLLGRIPVLGRLFRNRSDQTDVRDLVFTITPRIVDSDDYHLNTGNIRESAAKLRHRFKTSGQIGNIVFEDRVINHFWDKNRFAGEFAKDMD